VIISVIACGPSALRCGAQQAPGVKIAVNDAYRFVECSYVVSMDGRWFQHRAEDFCDSKCPTLLIRGKTIKKRGSPQGCRKIEFDNNRETTKFGPSCTELNGENSGYCALNLAYLLGPERVYLYGFDMNYENGKDHFFGDYEWKGEGCSNSGKKFAKWVKEMEDAAEQFEKAGIEVFNTNPQSAIKAFKYGTP